jgi:2-phosphoglycerate kinase
MNKVILIGGAPTNGKSYVTRKLSDKFNLPWISTDTIRETMRELVRPEDYPRLFKFAGETISAEEYLSSHTPEQIVASQNEESEVVWKGVKAFIEKDYVWQTFIIEGVAILPHLVASLNLSETQLFPIFLVDEDKERVKDVVYTRGLWADANTYSDEVKPIEVEWAMLFSSYLKSECGKYGYKPYFIKDREKLMQSLASDVQNWVAKTG